MARGGRPGYGGVPILSGEAHTFPTAATVTGARSGTLTPNGEDPPAAGVTRSRRSHATAFTRARADRLARSGGARATPDAHLEYLALCRDALPTGAIRCTPANPCSRPRSYRRLR